MEIKVLENVENRLLGRREISFLATYENGTLSVNEAKEEICKKLGLKPETTVISRIDQKFGLRQSEVIAHSYQSKESMDKYERKYLAKRLGKKGETKPTEEKKEAAQ